MILLYFNHVKIAIGSVLTTLFTTLTVAQLQTTHYSVILEPDSNIKVLVNVDNQRFPLTIDPYSIVYQGGAPVAKTGYFYEIVDRQTMQITSSEPFIRAPVGALDPQLSRQQDVYHDFYNRSTNIHTIASLPQIYPPLSYISRIPSQLHNHSIIPTIHLYGNETAAELLLHPPTLRTPTNNQATSLTATAPIEDGDDDNDADEDQAVELNMTYYGLQDSQSFENVKVSIAGRSSRSMPKLSYNIKLPKSYYLYGYRQLKLRSMAFDASYVRERVAHAALNSVGVPTSDFSYVRVFLNTRPIGLYGLVESFRDSWANNEFGSGVQKFKAGPLYQGQAVNADACNCFNKNTQCVSNSRIATSDLSFEQNITMYGMGQYKIKAGQGGKLTNIDYEPLQSFTSFLATSSNLTSAQEWNLHLDTTGFTRAMVLEDLLGFSDGYMTLADNFALYNIHNTLRMIYIPTDFDMSLGLSLFKQNLMLSGDYSEHPGFRTRPLTNKLYSNPLLRQSYQEVHRNLSQYLVHPSVMYPFIDSVVNMIYPDVLWDQSLHKHSDERYRRLSVANFSSVGLDCIEKIGLSSPNSLQTNVPVPENIFDFNSSLYGPVTSDLFASVKGFIDRKSKNVNNFYNVLINNNNVQ
ncbi:coth protein-domain-containing protein [Mycotypha africana]|uniref:coth protein-domain-containing protein n=1 Tax=Mycotypha africana TaxID=64632 RepID=UPI002301B230|nr:coth protein-domain-containing protein [Mycotypha africana]KAI8979092.1 coth protein-domain-containing protein [Mycotypha africana]